MNNTTIEDEDEDETTFARATTRPLPTIETTGEKVLRDRLKPAAETSGGGDDDDDDDDGVEDDGKRREQHEHEHILGIGIYREIFRTRTVLCSAVTESGTRLRFRVSVVHGHRLSVVGESVGAISTSGESRRALSRAREY